MTKEIIGQELKEPTEQGLTKQRLSRKRHKCFNYKQIRFFGTEKLEHADLTHQQRYQRHTEVQRRVHRRIRKFKLVNLKSGVSSMVQWVKNPLGIRRYRRCWFNFWVRKIPWRRKWQLTQVFQPEKSQGQRNLAGYILWDSKQLDTAEQVSTNWNHPW